MFEIKYSDLAGRIGVLHTNHGKIETPAFVPVIHPVKQSIPAKKIKEIGFDVVITNAYITMKRLEDRARKEGIHKIIKYDASYQILDINKFAIENDFGERINDGIEVDTTRLKNEIQKLNLNKLLIVGHLAPYVLDESDIDLVIILRKNPYDLIEIYKKRSYQDSKIKQNTGSEILGVIANDSITSFGKEKSFEIDVTNKTPERILEKIDGIINNQKGGDMVDWLRLVEEKNEIGKFFDY